MSLEEKIVELFKTMGNIGSAAEQRSLRSQARSHSLDGWKAYNRTIVGTAGAVSGIPGGLIGVTLEGVDIGILLNRCARASYGIGYILRRNEELLDEFDMTMILAVWAGSAIACPSVPAGKLALKTSLKGATHVTVVAVNSVGTTIATKASTKLLAKSSASLVKFGAKAASVVGKKLAVKSGQKLAFKAIPLIGGIAGLVINLWVLNGLMDAAEQYYRNEYVVPQDSEVIRAMRSATGLA